eukprot:scaffold76801_cov17-Tisochrysis_lutea.AAC.1
MFKPLGPPLPAQQPPGSKGGGGAAGPGGPPGGGKGPRKDKVIVFSQWTSMLDLLELPLTAARFGFRRKSRDNKMCLHGLPLAAACFGLDPLGLVSHAECMHGCVWGARYWGKACLKVHDDVSLHASCTMRVLDLLTSIQHAGRWCAESFCALCKMTAPWQDGIG